MQETWLLSIESARERSSSTQVQSSSESWLLQVQKTKGTESKADLFALAFAGTRCALIQPAQSEDNDVQALFYPLSPREGSFRLSLEARLTFLLKIKKTKPYELSESAITQRFEVPC